MRSFWSFVVKEMYHIFRDYKTLLILFGLPIAELLIFGFVISNEIKDVNIAILDHSKDDISKEITTKILSSGRFQLAYNLDSEKAIERAFKTGTIKEVIIFPADFARDLYRNGSASIQVIADASDANTASLVVNYTSGIIREYMHKLQASPVTGIVPEIRMVFNEDLRDAYMFVPGTMALILMLVSAMMTSISIAREKEFGTMEALLISPLNPFQIILGKVTPYFLLSFINAGVIIGLGSVVFNVPVVGSLVLLFAETLLFIMLALSIGILISTVSKTQQSAMFISMFSLMLPTILLSGFIFPIENMPEILQWVSSIIPPKWYIIIVKNIMLKGTGFSFIWKETLILVIMMMFFIFLSIKKFSIRLSK
jgi:ABC-2 type transport system permease protein